MKKIIAAMLAALMLFAFAACSESGTENGETAGETLVLGGFTLADSPVITDEVSALVEKATSELVGAEYKPVAYIARQIVAGTNHLILCEITPVVPDPVSHYALVTVYEKLDGGAEILNVADSVAEGEVTWDEPVPGGWYSENAPVLSDEAKTAVEKATGNLSETYTPVALLAQQVVAGMNYSVLCAVSEQTSGSLSEYKILHIYADLSGKAEITDSFGFESETEE